MFFMGGNNYHNKIPPSWHLLNMLLILKVSLDLLRIAEISAEEADRECNLELTLTREQNMRTAM